MSVHLRRIGAAEEPHQLIFNSLDRIVRNRSRKPNIVLVLCHDKIPEAGHYQPTFASERQEDSTAKGWRGISHVRKGFNGRDALNSRTRTMSEGEGLVTCHRHNDCSKVAVR